MNLNVPHRKPSILVPNIPADPPGADPSLTVLIRELAARAVEAVREAGAIVVPFDHAGTVSVAEAVDGSDGVLLLGGGDVDPAEYGEHRRHPKLYNVDRRTDQGEIGIVQAAAALRRPVLGICRGMHVINVAHGGTLVQHMPETGVLHRGPRGSAMVDHDVLLEGGSLVAAILGRSSLTVRSGHHQSVERLAPDLRVGAQAEDGTVEAVEDADRRILAVQWHPEDDLADADDRMALFAWLADESRRRARRSAPAADQGDQVIPAH